MKKTIKNLVLRYLKHRLPLQNCLTSIPVQGKVLDVGCFGLAQYKKLKEYGREDVNNYGVDYIKLTDKPDDFNFEQLDLNKQNLPYTDDQFDLIVASHVIEHLTDPMNFLLECKRVCKVGGKIYIEAPSEKTLWEKSEAKNFEMLTALNFYDDPTHLGRPWPLMALNRAGLYSGLQVNELGSYQNKIIKLARPVLLIIAKILNNSKLYEFVIWYSIGWANFAVFEKKIEGDDKNFDYFI